MKKVTILIALTCAIASGAAVRGETQTAASGDSKIRPSAWIVYWDVRAGIEALKRNPTTFHVVNMFNFAFDEEGHVIENEPILQENPALTEFLVSNEILVYATIVNDVVPQTGGKKILKDPKIIHKILQDKEQRARHIEDIINLVRLHRFDGVDIDYENLYYVDRDHFTDFVKELSASLRAHRRRLAVTVQQKTRETKSNGPGAINWAAIAPHVDEIRIMCYHYSSPKSEPGPVAPPEWIEKIISYARTQIPSQKITAAITLQGFDWGENGAESVTYELAIKNVQKHGTKKKRSPDDATPNYAYMEAKQRREVWYEDAESLRPKLEVLRRQGIGNIALWRLGREDPDIYKVLAGFGE